MKAFIATIALVASSAHALSLEDAANLAGAAGYIRGCTSVAVAYEPTLTDENIRTIVRGCASVARLTYLKTVQLPASRVDAFINDEMAEAYQVGQLIYASKGKRF